MSRHETARRYSVALGNAVQIDGYSTIPQAAIYVRYSDYADAIDRCDAELSQLRARVAELEAIGPLPDETGKA